MSELVVREYKDLYSFCSEYNWAIFIIGETSPVIKGLSKESVPFYMEKLQQILEKKNAD